MLLSPYQIEMYNNGSHPMTVSKRRGVAINQHFVPSDSMAVVEQRACDQHVGPMHMQHTLGENDELL